MADLNIKSSIAFESAEDMYCHFTRANVLPFVSERMESFSQQMEQTRLPFAFDSERFRSFLNGPY